MVVLRLPILTQILFPPPIRQFLYNAYGGAVRNHRTSHPLPHATSKPTEPPHHALTLFLPVFFFFKNDSRPTISAGSRDKPHDGSALIHLPKPTRRKRKRLHENGTPALILSTIYSAHKTAQNPRYFKAKQGTLPESYLPKSHANRSYLPKSHTQKTTAHTP